MSRVFFRSSCVWGALLALVVSVDVTPEAADMLLQRGNGLKDVWIANVFYQCRAGNSFAMVRNGLPQGGAYDAVDTEQVRVHVPKDMSFTDDIPKIVVFPRKNGRYDVGVPNTMDSGAK